MSITFLFLSMIVMYLFGIKASLAIGLISFGGVCALIGFIECNKLHER